MSDAIYIDGLLLAVETITPDLAEKWLGKNAKNRPIQPHRVRTLERAISRGEWVLDGAPIRFNAGGDLIDGQHRLSAIARGTRSVKSLVVGNVPESAMRVMDGGKPRSLGDVLAIEGTQNSRRVAAAARATLAILQTGCPSNSDALHNLTTAQVAAWIDQTPSFVEMVSDKGSIWTRGASGLIPIGPALAMYWFWSAQDECADDFFDTLFGRQAGSDGDPAWMLRERLQKAKGSKVHGLSTETKLAFTVKAWRAYRDNKPMTRFFYRKFGKTAEPFPEVNDLPATAEAGA